MAVVSVIFTFVSGKLFFYGVTAFSETIFGAGIIVYTMTLLAWVVFFSLVVIRLMRGY